MVGGTDYQGYLMVVSALNGLCERLGHDAFVALSIDRWRSYSVIWREQQIALLMEVTVEKRLQLGQLDVPEGSEVGTW